MNGLPPKCAVSSGSSGGGTSKRTDDPYDFDDDMSATGASNNNSMDTFKRKDALDKEEAKTPGSVRSTHDPHSPSQPKKSTGNLYTIEGLQPSLADLDEMFDSDSPVDDVSCLQKCYDCRLFLLRLKKFLQCGLNVK